MEAAVQQLKRDQGCIRVDAGFARVLARSHSQCFANTVFCIMLLDAGSARVLALCQGHGFVNYGLLLF